MFNIRVKQAHTTFEIPAESGELISAVLSRAAIDFALPCAGNHTCGKCKVRVTGKCGAPDDTEARMLSAEELSLGVRLACCCRVNGNACVTLPAGQSAAVLAWAKLPDFERTERGFGLAADIGTTTVAMRLIDRTTGEILATASAENRQRRYGADVISRVSACAAHGTAAVSAVIIEQIEDLARQCMQCAHIAKVDECVVTGNTAMLHLFAGLDPASLGASPFAVQSYFGRVSDHRVAGAPVYLPRAVGAFVGADITCAILASGMTRQTGTTLLVDIGTNGEMALCQNGTLRCCATAAGPAFEGAGLSMGMPAAGGAIRAVSLCNGEVRFDVIGEQKALGICGSGVIDALRVMKELDIIDESGYLEEDFFIGSSGVRVTQQDIRQIQLAKSAVCAGILTLLHSAGVTPRDIERFYIAGGFGGSMNSRSAAAIGLYPAELEGKMVCIGNGALGGASMLLLNRKARREAEFIAKQAEEISLSTSPFFTEAYVACMVF